MPIPTDIIQKINHEIGSPGRPHRIFAGGQWTETEGMEWPLPPESEGGNAVLIQYNQLSKRYLDRLRTVLGENYRELESLSQPPVYEPGQSQRSYRAQVSAQQARMAEFIAGIQDEELQEIKRQLDRFLAPYRPTFVYGMPVLDMSDITPADPVQGVNRLLWKVRELIGAEPYFAYRANLAWMTVDVASSDTLAVIPGTDPFDALRIEQTNAYNYGLGPEAVIGKLKELDGLYGIDIVGASFAAVEFLLKAIPKGREAHALGKWLLEFCPDIAGAPKRFPKGRVALWWD